jgi:hypothetical protein
MKHGFLRAARAGAIGVVAVALAAGAAPAGDDAPPFTARAGETLARDAAAAWSEDARLVYVENDEPLADAGLAGRWGYLFHSPSLDAVRAYSVRDGKIRTAMNPRFDFEAPPLPGDWIDSGEALAAAEKKGREFREKHAGTVRAMFLVRGILDPEHPDAPTWAVVYDSDSAPGLWVVVDARSGKVVKTWRG